MSWTTFGRILWTAAVIPPIVLLIYIYKKDRVEKEPPLLLGKLFLGGALSVISAMALETAGMAAAGWLLPKGSAAYAAVCCFAVVGVAEEGGKFFFLRQCSWKSPEFNYRFDAIVYAVFVSMGFALVENLLYVLGDGTLETALLRGVTAIPGHAALCRVHGLFLRHSQDVRRRCGPVRRPAAGMGVPRPLPAVPAQGRLGAGPAPRLLRLLPGSAAALDGGGIPGVCGGAVCVRPAADPPGRAQRRRV